MTTLRRTSRALDFVARMTASKRINLDLVAKIVKRVKGPDQGLIFFIFLNCFDIAQNLSSYPVLFFSLI